METVFHFDLCREETNTTKKVDLVFPSLPATFLEIKEEVERRFSIPVCVQTLCYQSNKKTDSDDLISSYVRSGDTFLISYPIEGECERVIRVVQWLKQIVESLLENLEKSKTSELAKKYVSLMPSNLRNDLSQHLFYPWSNMTKYVNKLHFDALGGVEVLMSCYGALQTLRQRNIRLFKGDLLEAVCSWSVLNFTQTFPLRRQVVRYGGLEYCINTFLWKSLNSGLDWLYRSAIEASANALCNISELPEVQLQLAQRSDVLEQNFEVAMSSLYQSDEAITCMSFLLCLAQCQEAHVYLLKPSMVESVLKICRVKTLKYGHTDPIMILESYAGIVLSQMILGSAQYLLHFPESLLQKVIVLMERICNTNPVAIRAYEIKDGLEWETCMPFVNYLYSPVKESVKYSKSLFMKLHHLGTEVLLHALQTAVGRNTRLKTIIREGLLDYIVVLPWHMPESSRGRARDLVQDVGKSIRIELPSLCSLAKAKLAKESLGLKKVLEMESVTDLCLHMEILQL